MPISTVLIRFLAAVKQALTPCEDYWTWTTLDGDYYEEVELLQLEQDHVTFSHKFGVASIRRDNLSEQVQRSLREDVEIRQAAFVPRAHSRQVASRHAISRALVKVVESAS